MRKIVEYFIKYPYAGNLLVLLLIVFGLFGLSRIQSTVFPEVPTRQINITVIYPGSSPTEIEEGVVQKIENNLRGITGIEKVTSVSKENAGSISVEILKSAKPEQVLEDVKNAVNKISSFPTGMEPPIIFKIEPQNFAISFALSGETDLRNLKAEARKIEQELLAVEGISKVAISGFPEEEIEIAFRENDLRAYNISFQQASQAIQAANLNITGGTIKSSEQELLIRSDNKAYFTKEIENIILKAEDGRVVRLKDVAEINDQWADIPARTYFNGKSSVVLSLNNTNEEDILFITDYVNKYIVDYNLKNGAIKASVINDGSINLRQRIDLLLNNGMIGFVLVLLFLSLFLNVRIAFWVALGIPVAFFGFFIIGDIANITINVISLFGMIIVIGILVDDGIVIAENIYQHFEKGKDRFQAAVDATMEVIPSIVSAILTTVVAFLLFFFLEGRVGDIFSVLSFVVTITLLISLVEAVLILPSHVANSKSLHKDYKPNWLERKFTKIMDRMRYNWYKPVLTFAINNRFLSLSIAVGILIMTFGLVGGGFVKTTFFPFIERDNVDMVLEMPSGTPSHVTKKWLDYAEAQIIAAGNEMSKNREDSLPVILNIQKNIGPEPNKANLNIILMDGERRQIPALLIGSIFRDSVGSIPGAENLSFGGKTPFGSPVSVSLLGSDINELKAAVEEFKIQLNALTEIKDVIDNDQEGPKEINIELKEKAWQLGLNTRDVLAQVRQGFFGFEVQRLQRGQDEVKVWVRYNKEDRSNIGNLEDIRIKTPDGKSFPLSEIANLTEKSGVIAINHLNGFREIKIDADIANAKVSVPDIMTNVKEVILPPILEKYPSVKTYFGGQSEQSAKTGKSAKSTIPAILISMIALMAFNFRSVPQALMVFILIPLSIAGVIIGHWFHGTPISILSALGILALIGILVNDALVLVSTYNDKLKNGMNIKDAIIEAGVSRFRPIILTSVTTIAGLAPLILEKSFQAQFLVPMAISIAYGLAWVTLLNLIVLPVILLSVNQLKINLRWLWTGVKPKPEEVEHVTQELYNDKDL